MILGLAIALLLGMLVLVICEALVPSGTMPGPLYLIRGLRKRARRMRRYSQITRILVRRGMLPYLRGARRAELQTHDGRVLLAGSLRLRRASVRMSKPGASWVSVPSIVARSGGGPSMPPISAL